MDDAGEGKGIGWDVKRRRAGPPIGVRVPPILPSWSSASVRNPAAGRGPSTTLIHSQVLQTARRAVLAEHPSFARD